MTGSRDRSRLAHLVVVTMVSVLILSPVASGVGPVGTASASDGIHYVTDSGFEVEDVSGGSARPSFTDDNTLDLSGINLSSTGTAFVTLDQRTGTFTNLTNVDDSPSITATPDDKQAVALMGGFDSLNFSDASYPESDSSVDLVYSASNDATLRVESTGQSTGDTVYAVDVDSGSTLGSGSVASNGSVTFTAVSRRKPIGFSRGMKPTSGNPSTGLHSPGVL